MLPHLLPDPARAACGLPTCPTMMCDAADGPYADEATCTASCPPPNCCKNATAIQLWFCCSICEAPPVDATPIGETVNVPELPGLARITLLLFLFFGIRWVIADRKRDQ